jgi:hypothetical protein
MQDIAHECGEPDDDEPEVRPAEIPPSYFDERVTARVELTPDARFVDLAHPDTHASLAEAIGPSLGPGSPARFTRSTLFCGTNRRITRSAARYYYELSQTGDDNYIVGLRFEVCAPRDWEFWALWEGPPVDGHPWWVSDLDDTAPVTREDHDVLIAADKLKIAVAGR